MYFFSYGHSVSALIMGIYDRPGDSCNHISSSLHLIVTYSRYLETFKCQNVEYTLHGVWSTLHHHLLKNTRRAKHYENTKNLYRSSRSLLYRCAGHWIGRCGSDNAEGGHRFSFQEYVQ